MLLPERSCHRHHGCNKMHSVCTLNPNVVFAPKHPRTARPPCRMGCRFNLGVAHERPQCLRRFSIPRYAPVVLGA
jgi:hypothetical protein